MPTTVATNMTTSRLNVTTPDIPTSLVLSAAFPERREQPWRQTAILASFLSVAPRRMASCAAMIEPRLKTEIWVKAAVRRGAVENIPVVVVKKGDPDGGA